MENWKLEKEIKGKHMYKRLIKKPKIYIMIKSIMILIQKARADKGLTQKELAQKLNIKPVVINEYETGKAIVDRQLLNKMSGILGVKLTGKNIGYKI